MWAQKPKQTFESEYIYLMQNALNKQFLPKASFGLRVLSLTVSVCVFICVFVCQPWANLQDNFRPIQTTII